MAKRGLLTRKVEDIEVSASAEVARLVEAMGRGGGFTAKKVAVGVEILRTMFRRSRCTTFLSFPAALMATGVRGVLRALVQERLVDVVVTTCGTADHDLARVWQPYYHGEFEMDDVALHRLGVNRLGNVLIPNASYGIVLEKKVQPMLRDLWDSGVWTPSTSELLWGLGHAVYITTAPEWDGSLSGARVREGISWGKVKETANQVTIEGDASAILPMMIAAALGRPHR